MCAHFRVVDHQPIHLDHLAAIGFELDGGAGKDRFAVLHREDERVVGAAQEPERTGAARAFVLAIARDGAEHVDDLGLEAGRFLAGEIPGLGFGIRREILCQGGGRGQKQRGCGKLFHRGAPHSAGSGIAKDGTGP